MKNNKGKISYALQTIICVPLLFFCIVLLCLGTHFFTKAMQQEVEVELSNASSDLLTMLDALYPGDFSLVEDTGYRIYKGDCDITSDYSLIDKISENTGFEITLFYQDTRILTTVVQNGTRIVGSGAPDTVMQDVFQTGEPRFYEKTIIYNTAYFTYYMPLRNQDGTVVGMLALGKSADTVDAAIRLAILPLVFAGIALTILVALCTFLYTKKFSSSLEQIRGFLKEVSHGNLNTKLSPSVLDRRDELGEMAHSALTMQQSLRTLVDQDALTLLPNRRSGEKRLRQLAADSSAGSVPFCAAIGDIDFFKRINDTYGHECGDVVLRNIASILRSHMYNKGFSARWGGEEFLLVYENASMEDAHTQLEALVEEIRSTETHYGGQAIKVTMTFGLAAGSSSDTTVLLREADARLYQGKNAGRDRIVPE